MAGRGLEALLEGREESGGPPKGPGGVGRPYRRAVRGWEALPEGQQGSGGHTEWPRGVGRGREDFT